MIFICYLCAVSVCGGYYGGAGASSITNLCAVSVCGVQTGHLSNLCAVSVCLCTVPVYGVCVFHVYTCIPTVCDVCVSVCGVQAIKGY
jgi:hypothetical protein